MKSERMSRTCWEADGDRGSLSDLSDSLGSLGSLSSLSGSPAVSTSLEKLEPIDNRIQQALDLVKSHLLLAVREEVDLLKANISKLADRIGVLERENRMLKKGVPPEVLAKLRKTPALASHARQQTPEGHTTAH